MSGSGIITKGLRRPLPSFTQWLADNGDGTRGDGFDAYIDQVHRTIERGALPDYNDDSRSLLRLYTGLSIAIIEACNIERQKDRSPEQIVQLMPRALAMCAITAVASIMRDDSDAAAFRSVAKVLTEEFRWATKEAADDFSGPESC